MRIILTSLGTRGDIEPFLAIGELLKEQGHEVICAFESEFESLVIESRMEFLSLDGGISHALLKDRLSHTLKEKFSLRKLGEYRRLYLDGLAYSRELVYRQSQVVSEVKPDKVIYSGLTNYPVIWSMDHPGKAILLLPVPFLYHYVQNHSFLLFRTDFGPMINKWTYRFAHYLISQGIALSARKSNIEEKTNASKIRKFLKRNKTIYTISRALFPQPDYWEDHSKVLGFYQRTRRSTWYPDQKLLDFLIAHEKIVFVTFGSMINRNPEKVTRIFMDIFTKYNIPVIFNTFSGGLIAPSDYDHTQFLFVSSIPYDYIFRHIHSVIHHGGSGTTHNGLKWGCPTLIIPHIFDQFVWNDLIAERGLGPKGPSIYRFTCTAVESKILDLYTNESYKERAVELARKMNEEDLKEELCRFILEP